MYGSAVGVLIRPSACWSLSPRKTSTMSLAARLGSAFPKWAHIFRAAEAGATPLPELRRVCSFFDFRFD
jgi:hypothetical protein